MNGVEVAGTIEASDLLLGQEILHRQAKTVKFYGDKIITGKLANRNKVFDEGRCNENISKKKGFVSGR